MLSIIHNTASAKTMNSHPYSGAVSARNASHTWGVSWSLNHPLRGTDRNGHVDRPYPSLANPCKHSLRTVLVSLTSSSPSLLSGLRACNTEFASGRIRAFPIFFRRLQGASVPRSKSTEKCPITLICMGTAFATGSLPARAPDVRSNS